MTLRDYFAAQAMNLAAIVAAGNALKGDPPPSIPTIAADCYRLADALIAASKEPAP